MLDLLHIATIATAELMRVTERDGHADLHAELLLASSHLDDARTLAARVEDPPANDALPAECNPVIDLAT